MRDRRGWGTTSIVGLMATAVACGESSPTGGAGGGGGDPIGAGGMSSGGADTGGAATGGSGTGGDPDPHWSCLGDVTWPELEVTTMNASLQFFDEDDPTFLVTGASVRACRRDDLDCLEPEAEGTTDDQGRVALQLVVAADSPGWQGYFEIDPGAGSGFPVNLIPTVRPYTNDPQIEFGLVNDERLAGGVYLLTGAAPDPERGHLAAIVFECTDQPTAGAAIALDPGDGATIGYVDAGSGLPDSTLGETGSDGLALAANVAAGYVSVSGTRTLTGESIGTTNVPVRPGAITTFGLLPTP